MNSSQNIDTHDRCAVVMAIIAAHSLTKYGFPVPTITFVNKKSEWNTIYSNNLFLLSAMFNYTLRGSNDWHNSQMGITEFYI